jgi:hypothetical protein
MVILGFALIGIGRSTGPSFMVWAGLAALAFVLGSQLRVWSGRIRAPRIKPALARLPPIIAVAAALFLASLLIDSGFEPTVVGGTVLFVAILGCLALLASRQLFKLAAAAFANASGPLNGVVETVQVLVASVRDSFVSSPAHESTGEAGVQPPTG